MMICEYSDQMGGMMLVGWRTYRCKEVERIVSFPSKANDNVDAKPAH